MIIKSDGIIIRESPTGEQDRIVTILTRECGVIKAFANGARNPKNRNVSSTGLFCYSDFLISKNQKGIYVVREANARETFFSLRGDITRLSLAQYFAELAYELSPREEQSGEYLSLLLNSIYLLSRAKKSSRQIKSVLELRLLSIAGYMPNIVACNSCGKFESDEMFFDTYTGELFCDECKPLAKTERLPLSVVTAMRHICFCESGRLFSFNLPEDGLELLSKVTEGYLRKTTGRRYKTLDFFNMMTN